MSSVVHTLYETKILCLSCRSKSSASQTNTRHTPKAQLLETGRRPSVDNMSDAKEHTDRCDGAHKLSITPQLLPRQEPTLNFH